MNQGVYWLLTIPHADFLPFLPTQLCYIRGQLELAESGYLHWQVLCCFRRRIRLLGVKSVFGNTTHAELARSDAARQYVWKLDTSVPNTQFELGTLPIRRANATDWEAVLTGAKNNDFSDIPADIVIRNYNALKSIAKDHLQPVALERRITVYWGRTGTGKSRLAWEEAGMGAYPKDPCTKFWDGYQQQEHVVIDEYRGSIGISHMLRWCDRYPVIIEAKHGATTLSANRIWITSNIHPRQWYPELDEETQNALLRRLEITHFDIPFNQ